MSKPRDPLAHIEARMFAAHGRARSVGDAVAERRSALAKAMEAVPESDLDAAPSIPRGFEVRVPELGDGWDFRRVRKPVLGSEGEMSSAMRVRIPFGGDAEAFRWTRPDGRPGDGGLDVEWSIDGDGSLLLFQDVADETAEGAVSAARLLAARAASVTRTLDGMRREAEVWNGSIPAAAAEVLERCRAAAERRRAFAAVFEREMRAAFAGETSGTAADGCDRSGAA